MCETCVNRSCSKTETLLKRRYTSDPVCLLYASLLHISKEKTVWRTQLHIDNIFQSPDKKSTSPARTQIKTLEIYEKNRIKLDIFINFLKKKQFFRLLNNNSSFLTSFWKFEGLRCFWIELFIFCSKCQPTVVFVPLKVILDRDLQTIFHPSVSYCFQ